jgi:hypothetical protein
MDSPLSDEFEKIFYQQFKSARIYIDIIKLLSKGAKTFQEVSTSLNIASGGSLKKYLDNLFLADFIGSYYPFHRGDRSKDKKYFLSDEFCHFYLQYIEKNHSAIRNNTQQDLFSKITKKNWSQYLALNFERFCFKEANTIAQYCGFRDEVKEIGKFYPDAKVNIQLDLVYSRFDEVITIFEIKSGEQIGVQIINEFEKKMETLKRHPAFYKRKIEKGIIYLGKIDPAIAKLKYFHYLIDIDDLGL